MTESPRFPLRAILRNAITWAAAWGVAGGAISGVIAFIVPGKGVESLAERVGMSLFATVSWGTRFALAGAVIGTVFATVVRLGYRGQKLANINPVRFGLLGAVVGGVGVPLFLQTMNVLSDGHTIAWNLVTDDAVWASVFGAAVAAGSIFMARRAVAVPNEESRVPSDGTMPPTPLPTGTSPAQPLNQPLAQRERAGTPRD